MSAQAVTTREPNGLQPGGKHWHLAVRAGGLLIAKGGRVRGAELRHIARKLGFEGSLPPKGSGKSGGSRAAAAVYRVMCLFRDFELARREGEDVVAIDLSEVAAWLAEEFEQVAHIPATERSTT